MGLIKNLKAFMNEKRVARTYAKMLNGQTPVFSSYGESVYEYDIVQNAINIICSEMMKLDPQHLRMDKKTGLQEIVKDSINRLFDVAPNPYMTTADFLCKCTYLYETTDNCYIYPTYTIQKLSKTTYKRIYTGFYPLNPSLIEFLEDEQERLYIQFTFGGGYKFTCPYEDIIHWRKNFTEDEYVGGAQNSRNQSFINLIQADNIATQSIEKSVKARLSINGLLRLNSLYSDEQQTKKAEEFEDKIKSMKYGIIPTDLKSEFVPINMDPKIVDKDTMTFIEQRILSRYGMSIAIYNGNYKEEDYQSFYEKKLENMIKSLGQAFTKCLFTQAELDKGNRIICFQQGLIYTSMANKIKVVDILSRIGGLTDNQIVGIFGYPPFDGGNVRHTSLNYIDRDIANDYQLSKIGQKEPLPDKDYVNEKEDKQDE